MTVGRTTRPPQAMRGGAFALKTPDGFATTFRKRFARTAVHRPIDRLALGTPRYARGYRRHV